MLAAKDSPSIRMMELMTGSYDVLLVVYMLAPKENVYAYNKHVACRLCQY